MTKQQFVRFALVFSTLVNIVLAFEFARLSRTAERLADEAIEFEVRLSEIRAEKDAYFAALDAKVAAIKKVIENRP